jgi:uncharacterized protein (TIGR03066 family)
VYNGVGQLTGEYQSHSGAVNTSTTPEVQYAYTEMSGGVDTSTAPEVQYSYTEMSGGADTLGTQGVNVDHTLILLPRGDVMRAILSCALGLLLSSGLVADDKKGGEKIDAKKLIGRWQPKDKKAVPMVYEFRKDGTLVNETVADDGTKFRSEWAYKVDGNKLTLTLKAPGKELTINSTITKLTDSELVGKDEIGQEQTLVRIKDK